MAGHETTLPITLEHMIYHAQCVVRGVRHALVVVDLPFGSYQGNSKEALASAVRVMKETGAHAVKLEGGVRSAKQIKRIVRAGIPVMAHIGFTPQSEHGLGGHEVVVPVAVDVRGEGLQGGVGGRDLDGDDREGALRRAVPDQDGRGCGVVRLMRACGDEQVVDGIVRRLPLAQRIL